ncbi:MAG: AMP-binding protein [Planctomycetes bacterium]|nr:AMP-binding protein [Planctomycetota bacterium]
MSIRIGELGVHPPGALGVAFFIHTSAERFIGRGGDGITQPLKDAGTLKLLDGDTLRGVPLRDRVLANLLEAEARDRMPELLLVCCNPDQVPLFTADMTRFLENLAERGRLTTVEDVVRQVPILLVLPNGILYEQAVHTYEEQLSQAVLLNRLPGVTPEMTAALLARVVRGVSLQAGGRRGSGPDTVYLLERKGAIVFAGGGEAERARIEAILTQRDYPFTHAHGVPGTRIEFDKAMISTVLNVGGLIHTVRPDGSLIDLRMGDLCKDPGQADFVHTVTRAVFDVGQAVGAYPPEATYEPIWARHRETILAHADHVTSSLKQFRDALSRGLKEVALFSNEEWILTPLGRYAARAGLKTEEELFRRLRREVQASMARAIHHRDGAGDGRSQGAKTMKLAAQRNVSIELFEAGGDEVILVGTMLDNEHLIKLEMCVYLPDEQITRSRLDMVRVPFPVCREVETVAERLVGLRIERGVLSEIGRRVGGRVGCSHIKELATNIVYFIASYLVRRRAGVDPVSIDFVLKPPEERFALTRGLLRDSCLAYCQTTARGLDAQFGIRRVGDDHVSPLPLGEYEPSFGVLLQNRATRWAERPYVRFRQGDEVRTITWRGFADTVFQIARHLMQRGVRPGDRVAMISENRAEMYLFELAVMAIRGVTVPVFAGYGAQQVAYVLGHARPRFVAVSGMHQLEKIERERYPWVKQFLCMDFDDACEAWGAVPFADLLSGGGASPEELDDRVNSVLPDDLCVVMYTSGTTGPPKGVKLCHRNLISQQKAISLIWDVDSSDVVMNYLPWHHSFGGLFERFLTLYHGCELCLDDSRGRDLDRLLDNWARFQPTIFCSVPRVHDQLVTRCRENIAAAQTVFHGRLRLVFSAGAPLPAHVESAYRERKVPVLEGWGLTETSPCVTLITKETAWRSGYVGLPIPGVTVRINTDQEILVKGPNVMGGYLDEEEPTAQVIDDEGWFHTGDVGEFTPHGLRLFGRKDGTFKLTTGEKVHPQRVENILVNESPYINVAVVFGSGKDYVAALLYPDMSRLREWAAERGLPEDGLLERAAVRKLYAAELERINPMIEVKYQRVRRATLIDRDPTVANGELTPTGKFVRKAALHNHRQQAEDIFAAHPADDVIVVEQPQLQRA